MKRPDLHPLCFGSRIPAIFAIVCGALILVSTAAAQLPRQRLLEQAQRESKTRFQYAVENHASIRPTPDGKSFFVLWYPEGTDPKNPPPMIATIHGHGSWAFDEFFLWHRFAKERGYGILALQWWLGEGERFQDYLHPREIYRVIDQTFKEESVGSGRVLFHGFSRGSANAYAVAALDRQTRNNYFALFVANAGKPGLDFPSNIEIENGKFGERPLEGTRWVTYAGAKDTHPDRDGIQGMREAAEWIKRFGGAVNLSIEDPNGDHGGFHRNPGNVNAALDVFAGILDSHGRMSGKK